MLLLLLKDAKSSMRVPLLDIQDHFCLNTLLNKNPVMQNFDGGSVEHFRGNLNSSAGKMLSIG